MTKKNPCSVQEPWSLDIVYNKLRPERKFLYENKYIKMNKIEDLLKDIHPKSVWILSNEVFSPYCGHVQPHKQFWLLDHTKSCFNRLM